VGNRSTYIHDMHAKADCQISACMVSYNGVVCMVTQCKAAVKRCHILVDISRSEAAHFGIFTSRLNWTDCTCCYIWVSWLGQRPATCSDAAGSTKSLTCSISR
jgi:hypothetical protein